MHWGSMLKSMDPEASSLTASFLGVKYVSTFIFGATSANSFINNGSNLYSEVSPIETLKVTSAVKGQISQIQILCFVSEIGHS